MMVMMMITFMSFVVVVMMIITFMSLFIRLAVVVVMMMTYEWLGDNSNDDSDYHETPSTLRTMKIKM